MHYEKVSRIVVFVPVAVGVSGVIIKMEFGI